MAFGQLEAMGLALVVALIVLAALLLWALSRSWRLSREASSARASVLDLEDRARVGALRHRDFDQWFEADRKRRERVGLPALDREEAARRRFDPEYELDVPAPRTRDLRKVRGRVERDVRRGEEPSAPDDEASP